MTLICEKELSSHNCNYKPSKDVEHELRKSVKKLEKEFPVWKVNLQNQMQEHIDSNKIVLLEAKADISKHIDRIIEGYEKQLTQLIENKVILDRQLHIEQMAVLSKNNNIAGLLSIPSVESNSLEKSSIDAKFYFERDEIFKLIQNFLSLFSKQFGAIASVVDSRPIFDKYEHLEDEMKQCVSNVVLSDNRFAMAKGAHTTSSRIIGFTRPYSNNEYSESIVNTFVSKESFMKQKGGFGKPSMKAQPRQYTADPINESLVESQRSFGNIDDFESSRKIDNDDLISGENMDFDLEDEDFDFGDDEVLEKEHKTDDIKTIFENSHQKLLRILDRVLYDMNCPGFYDKSYRESANSYIDRFKEMLESVLKEVKNNFNRL
jgi:hypothetical protein